MQYRLYISVRSLRSARRFYKLSTPRIALINQESSSLRAGSNFSRGLDLSWSVQGEQFSPLSGFSTKDFTLGFNKNLIKLKNALNLVNRTSLSLVSMSTKLNFNLGWYSSYYIRELGDWGSKSVSSSYPTLGLLSGWIRICAQPSLRLCSNNLNYLLTAWWSLSSTNIVIRSPANPYFRSLSGDSIEESSFLIDYINSYKKSVTLDLGALEYYSNLDPDSYPNLLTNLGSHSVIYGMKRVSNSDFGDIGPLAVLNTFSILELSKGVNPFIICDYPSLHQLNRLAQLRLYLLLCKSALKCVLVESLNILLWCLL